LLTTKEGIRFFISSKTGIAVLAISVILICSILWYLIYRFIIFKKKKLKLIAGENLGPEEWEKQMIALARSHGRVKPSKYNFALDDYNQTAYKKLNRIRKTISRLSTDIIYLIPAARWLFDNFQIMYREIKKIRSSGTSYEILPVIKEGAEKGYPRIYVLAKHMVLLSGGHLDRENIILMVKAYQTECKLTDKELWVLPEMLGFCLLESIIEVSEDILRIIKLKSKAEKFVKDHLAAGQGGQDITPLLRKTDMDCRDDFSFHAHVVYLLKNMSVDHGLIQKYLDYHCIAKDLKLNSLFLEEGRIEAGHEARIRTLIISLREINELDSETLFEELSVLEQILLRDPEGYYGSMDAESRGMYREVIVKLARRHRMEEERVAFACLKLAQEGRKDLSHPHHVGSYLLGKGYPVLKCRALGKTEPTKLKRKLNVKGFLYFAVSALLLFGILFGLALLLNEGTDLPDLKKLFLLLVSLPLLIGIAMEISVFLFTRGILVKRLPALDYRKSIPDHARTFVVMPVILSSKEQGLEYLNRIERLYLANRQENLYYALLADYEDASEPTLPKDKIIEEALLARLEELNKAYPSPHMRFSLFTRYRKWNESEGCYMCWERKRGKLEEFNSLMCGERKEKTSFETICGCDELFGSFKYVITLDADSNLIWDNAAKLVGLMEHPLNQPVLDMQRRRVREGYAIIQPSVRNHIIDRKGSLFTMIFGGQSGLDHYSAVISDIYQDIFNQGTYIGKGIYHIEAFHTLLHGTIPENSVLSHDLLESCYARTAFSSSVKIMDTFPGSVLSYVKREHRWIRGDWQLLPWLFLRKTADHRKVCALSKWKIADNLRRSMVPLSKTLLILANLAWLPDLPLLWFPLVFFSDLFNILVMLLSLLKQKLLRPKLAFVYRSFLKELGVMLERAFLELVLTPYRAYIATDAAIRTLFRLFISRKNLLRWNTAESVDASIINTKKGYFLSMWSSLLAAALLLWLILARELSTLEFIVFGSVALLWTTAFLTAYYISLPREESDWEEPPEDLELLQQTAFRTWLFFKEFATKERNWLCPDNFQETHRSRISDKTSPTNIGLQFLSLLSARDLGYESLTSFLTQVENLLITVGKLPKYRGHLYNWYGVHSLEILNPAYISTVDSGNFLGHMIALKQGLAEQADQPILYKSSVKHLKSLLKLSNHNGKLKEDYRGIGEFIDDIRDIWEDMEGRNRLPCEEPRWCRRLSEMIEALVEDASAFQLKDSTFFSCPTLRQLAQKDHRKAKLMMEKIRELTARIDQVVENADFSFLYNEKRMLFHIGFHVDSQTLDAGCYDLIASESALTSFLCVARGEVPLKHWYKLGRPLTMIKGIPCFVSWSGTMFEYLMPNLVMKEYEGSVFAETARAAVLQHMKYARQMGIPWGISESQYFRFDLYSNYQYKAFGVPKLRLQPVRRTSLVVAPYASLLALEYAGRECLANLRRMMKMGVYGEYGFYEAVDFNGPDAGEMTPYRIVKSFMAHHQGMNLVAINNYLNHGIMRRRFHAEPMIRAAEVLLEEKRQNHLVSTAKRGYTINFSRLEFKQVAYGNRYVAGTAPASPVAGYLSNQKYSLMLTSDGDGFSSYEDRMIYRFRADPHANTGQYFYIRESGTGRVWSCAYHPTGREPEEYQVIFSHHGMDIKRRDGDISTHTTISLSPEHPMEIRKLVLTNHGKQTRQLEITSYMEIVSDSHLAELSHPAFNKLFIESEFIEGHAIFLSRRRSRKTIEKPYIMHMVRTGATLLKPVEYENDRLNFIGRNHSPADPEAILSGKALSNRSGFSNDPIMSLKVSVSLEAEEKVSLYFMTGVCDSREEAIKIGEELNVPYRIEDLLEKYRLQSEIELKYLEISKQQLNAFQDMISPIFYPNRSYRGPELKLRRNVRNQSFLWKFGVSGDNPILLLTVDSIEQEGVIRDVLKAYEYLRINRVMADLIILIDGKHGYLQKVDDLINDLTSALKVYDSGSEKPSFYVLHTYQMIPAEIDLLYTVARIVFNDRTGIYFKDSKGNLKAYMDERYG
jgi:hypothetical protein